MPNKFKILIFILVLASVIFTYNKFQSKSSKNTDNVVELEMEKPNNESNKKPSIQDILRAKKKIQEISQKKEVIQIIPSIYDEDPVVDANLIIGNNRLCINYLTYNKDKTDKYIKRFEKNLSTKQRQYYQAFYKHCHKVNQQHPEYHLTDINILKQQKKQAQATSTWGKIIKGEINVDSLSENEISNLLKQNSSTILSQAPRYLNSFYDKVVHWDIEETLNNHQYDYTQLITQYAHQLYLCQLGTDCSPNSSIMASLCYLNSMSCGLDYPQFIQQGLSMGQKADIQLAMSYLQSIYQ